MKAKNLEIAKAAGDAGPSSGTVAGQETRRVLHTYCDGGFGNRLNGLLTGMVLADLADLELQVVWPLNNWCGASFAELFTNPLPVIERELLSYVPERGNYHYLMTEDHLNQGVDYASPLAFASLDELLAAVRGDAKPIFLHTPLIPPCLPSDALFAALRSLLFVPEIIGRADDFLRQHRLQQFFGVQIRKTDFGKNAADEDNLFNLIKAKPEQRFFVCSDDQSVEKRFCELPNVVVHEKEAYVEKMNPGDWVDLTADHSGRLYHCNINRGAQSVRDAVVDLLILSHSQVVKTSNSTFLASALLLQNARVSSSQLAPSGSEAASMGISLFETIKSVGLPAPQGILQVGASYGQEMQSFLEHGVRYGVFIEPLPEPFAHLSNVCRQIPGYVAVQSLCTDESGKEYTFYVASNGGMSSSILKPANHLKVFDFVQFPDTVQLTSNTLDDVVAFLTQNGHGEVVSHLDTLYMDTQGSELRIMMGANKTLKQINYIFTEVMRGELYEKQAPFPTVCAWLDAVGFTLNNVFFGPGHSGDAMFVRKSLLGL